MNPDLVLFGLSATVVVKRLVNVCKLFGLHGKGALIMALVVGAALGALYEILPLVPEAEVYIRIVWTALVAGLGASELYEATKATQPGNEQGPAF